MPDPLALDFCRLNGERQMPLSISMKKIGGADPAALARLPWAGEMTHAGQAQCAMLPLLAGREFPAIAMRLARRVA